MLTSSPAGQITMCLVCPFDKRSCPCSLDLRMWLGRGPSYMPIKKDVVCYAHMGMSFPMAPTSCLSGLQLPSGNKGPEHHTISGGVRSVGCDPFMITPHRTSGHTTSRGSCKQQGYLLPYVVIHDRALLEHHCATMIFKPGAWPRAWRSKHRTAVSWQIATVSRLVSSASSALIHHN